MFALGPEPDQLEGEESLGGKFTWCRWVQTRRWSFEKYTPLLEITVENTWLCGPHPVPPLWGHFTHTTVPTYYYTCCFLKGSQSRDICLLQTPIQNISSILSVFAHNNAPNFSYNFSSNVSQNRLVLHFSMFSSHIGKREARVGLSFIQVVILDCQIMLQVFKIYNRMTVFNSIVIFADSLN